MGEIIRRSLKRLLESLSLNRLFDAMSSQGRQRPEKGFLLYHCLVSESTLVSFSHFKSHHIDDYPHKLQKKIKISCAKGEIVKRDFLLSRPFKEYFACLEYARKVEISEFL